MARLIAVAAALCATAMVTMGQMPMPKPLPPDPFGPAQRQWARPADGRSWGQSAGIEIGPHGEIWVIDRCGANSCDGSNLPAVHQLDPKTGRPVRSIGAGLFAFPHGLHVDKDGNIWVTDAAISKDKSKGQQVIKLSPEGKVLMRLGTAGVSAGGPTHFHNPGDVVTAPNGDIFVADGHDNKTNNRIVKYDSKGKYLKEWGKLGAGPGEFNSPHGLAMDKEGRL
ncbi:MAG TPA: hypothetical protein VLL04_09910, partial [Rhizomicrobium sp.]|nr:hypothetical protein [Rhizomicrobium sp.]